MKTSILCALSAVIILSVSSTASASQGFERHTAKGVSCQVCHGQDMKNPELPDENTCLQCHQRKAVAAKTKKLNPNPHTQAPHTD